jgi:hypothetical protein
MPVWGALERGFMFLKLQFGDMSWRSCRRKRHESVHVSQVSEKENMFC